MAGFAKNMRPFWGKIRSMLTPFPRQNAETPSVEAMPLRHARLEPPYFAPSVIIWNRRRSKGATAVREIAAEHAPARPLSHVGAHLDGKRGLHCHFENSTRDELSSKIMGGNSELTTETLRSRSSRER